MASSIQCKMIQKIDRDEEKFERIVGDMYIR